MNVNKLAEEITNDLRDLGRGSRQGHRPSAQEDFGVYTNDLRSVVKTYRKRLKSHDAELVLDLAQALLAKKVTECRQVAYELITTHKLAQAALNENIVESLGEGMDNWACVDTFCSNVAGPAWREGQLKDTTIERWASSADLWWRRAAVVSTVALNTKSRGGTGDVARTLSICEPLLQDTEVMVQKAISWALRELVPWDREAVETFILKQDRNLSARVKREVKRKLDTGKKN
ncbi:MAG: DNA alkylation repair protein [Cyanobacteria bacterium P01_C01_bin.118]